METNITNELFQKDLKRAETYLKSKGFMRLMKKTRKSLFSSINYLNKLYSETNPTNMTEFEDIILEDYKKQAEILFINTEVNNYYMYLLSNQYFQAHKDELDAYFEKVQDPNFKLDPADTSFDGCLTSYIYSLNKYFPEISNSIFEKRAEDSNFIDKLYQTNITLEEKLKLIPIYAKKTFVQPNEQKAFVKDCRLLLLGPKEYLDYDELFFKNHIIETVKQSIVDIISQLKNLGKYDEYVESQATQFRKMGLPNYMDSSVDLTRSAGSLDSLPIEDLLVLDSFWLNRYIKVLDNYAESLFILKDSNLLEQIPTNNFNFTNKISNETLYNELLKFQFLKKPATRFFRKIDYKIDTSQTDTIEGYTEAPDKNYSTFSFKPLCRKAKRDYGLEYNQFFSNLLEKSENDIESEIEFFSEMYSPISSAYGIKSSILQILATQLEHFQNSGIVLENKNSYKPLLGFDSHLTFPIFEHTSIQDLLDFYALYTHSTKVPIYDGYKDFIDLTNDFYRTKVALPVSKKQEETLKQMCKKRTYPEFSKNTIQHLYFLKNQDRLPDSFASSQTNKKKHTRSERRYFDLLDGKIYTKDISGKFVLQENNIHNVPTTNKEGDEYDDK